MRLKYYFVGLVTAGKAHTPLPPLTVSVQTTSTLEWVSLYDARRKSSG